jgi:hypothetical protein
VSSNIEKGGILHFYQNFVRWFAKKVDYTTPMYNDTTLYREEYSYFHNISNTYRSNLYNTRDGIPIRNLVNNCLPTYLHTLTFYNVFGNISKGRFLSL